MMRLTWDKFKAFVDERIAPVHYEDMGGYYEIEAFDGPVRRTCQLDKNPTDTTDIIDFETNYMPGANLSSTDGSGRTIIKSAASLRGTTYLSDFCTITTGLSAESLTWDLSAGNYTVKFYNASNTELSPNDVNCVKTVVTYAPPTSYEIIGGNVHIQSLANQSCKLWVIGGATDLAGYPGAVMEMVRNLDLECIQVDVKTDGRASKYMKISTDGIPYPTNKLQFITRHAPGYQYKFSIAVEIFR